MKADIRRRGFGKTGLKVTELSYGAMNLRELNTIDQAYQILNYVLDKGINLIDTARVYNGENGDLNLLKYAYDNKVGIIKYEGLFWKCYGSYL